MEPKLYHFWPYHRYWLVLALILTQSWSVEVKAGEGYLTAGESVGIGLSSTAIMTIGLLSKHNSNDKPPRWSNPPPFDASISRWLGGTPQPGKRNFLDDNFGSAITVVAAGAVILGTDIAYPRNDRTKDMLQDQFVFLAGALANKGVTDFFKSLVLRQRPIGYFAPEILEREGLSKNHDRNHGFFSGHASSAFYAMTFLNSHLRTTMRHELLPHEYHDWRWVAPLVTYGWAGFVGYTRIQAYRHYLTDVLAGAAVGTVIGLLAYELADNVRPDVETGAPVQFKLHFGVNF